MAAPALVVFDMAGTTVEDRGEVPGAFAAALAEHGIAATPDEIRRVRGASKREATRRFAPSGPEGEKLAARVFDTFRSNLADRYARSGVRPTAGATDVFAALRGRGVKVALNTGFDRDITRLLVDALGWATGVVDAIVCADDVANGRPAPDLIRRAMADIGVSGAERVASVGDTTLDLEAGHHAGVGWNIGVLGGAHERAALEAAPHTHLVDTLSSVLEIWPIP